MFGLQVLANGASRFDEPGVFVGFEKTARPLVANAASFGWPLAEMENQTLFFPDARPAVDAVTAGEFDVAGMLAVLSAKVEQDFSQRRVRVIKYRGSSYAGNAMAFAIGPRGMEVASADELVTALPPRPARNGFGTTMNNPGAPA